MLDFNNVPPQRQEPPPSVVYQGRAPWPQPEALVQAEPGEIDPDEDAPEAQLSPEATGAYSPVEPQPRQHYRLVKYETLSDHIADIARRLLGSENRDLSNREQLRFGTNGSVAVEIAGPRAGTYYNHEHARGGGPVQLISFEGGFVGAAAYGWLRDELGVEVEHEQARKRGGDWAARIDRTYDYRDESGALLFQVVRLTEPKDFRQRAPDGNWTVKSIRKVPYLLPELLAAPADASVFVVEGEKDALNMRDLGLTATCNAGGAGKWRDEFAQYFAGRDVVVLPDNDQAGRDHADRVAANLAPVARGVRILTIPDLPPKGDVSDWLASGGTPEALMALATAAPLYEQLTQTQCEVLPSDHESGTPRSA